MRERETERAREDLSLLSNSFVFYDARGVQLIAGRLYKYACSKWQMRMSARRPPAAAVGGDGSKGEPDAMQID